MVGVVAPPVLGRVATADAAFAPALVVRPRFVAGGPTRIAPLSRPDVAELLAEQSFNFASLGGDALATVAAIARATDGISVSFGDVGDAAPAIERLFTR